MLKGMTVHIVPHEGGWAVFGCDAPQMRLYFPQQEEAIEYANNYVTANDGRILIYQAEMNNNEPITLLLQLEQQFADNSEDRVPIST